MALSIDTISTAARAIGTRERDETSVNRFTQSVLKDLATSSDPQKDADEALAILRKIATANGVSSIFSAEAVIDGAVQERAKQSEFAKSAPTRFQQAKELCKQYGMDWFDGKNGCSTFQKEVLDLIK